MFDHRLLFPPLYLKIASFKINNKFSFECHCVPMFPPLLVHMNTYETKDPPS